jgi:two-component system, OmpR family, aerobic respiration control sensor histidine kinase ArcB
MIPSDYQFVFGQLYNFLPIYLKNTQGVYLWCHETLARFFEVPTVQQLLGKTDHDFMQDSRATKIEQIDRQVFKTGKEYVCEEDWVDSNHNSVIYVSKRIPIYHDLNHKIVGLLGISIDITEMGRTTRDQLTMLENIIAVMPGNVYWMDRNGVYLGCNDNEAQSIGLKSRKEIIGKRNLDISEFVIPSVLDPINQEVIEQGKTITVEEPALLHNGTRAIFLSQKVPMRNSEGEIVGMVGVSIDITERKKAEEKLLLAQKEIQVLQQEQHRQFYAIIDAIPASIYWKDKAGCYLGANKYMLDIVGLKHFSEIIGKNDQQFTEGKSAQPIQEIDQQVIRNRMTLVREERPKVFNQPNRVFLTTKSPLFNAKRRVIGLIGVSVDITDRKQAEQDLKSALQRSEEASQLKTEFIRNIHHDLRTPTSGIYSMTQLLSESDDLAMIQDSLKEVSEAAGELLNYCNSILDFSTIEQGHRAVIEKKFNLKQLIEQVITLEKPAIHQKGLAFTFDYDAQIPEQLIGDEQRLYRILMNLIGNAIKFTERGSVTLQASVMTRHHKTVVISIRIKDTGIGIPQDKQTLIYEKLTRLNPSNRGQYKGLGLGLTIVKQFIMEMEGEIEVDSEVNQGTQFTCILPFKIPLALRNDE